MTQRDIFGRAVKDGDVVVYGGPSMYIGVILGDSIRCLGNGHCNPYDFYLYCGKKNLKIFEDDNLVKDETGHLYINCSSNYDDFEDFIAWKEKYFNHWNFSNFSALGHDDWEYSDFVIVKNHKNYESEMQDLIVPESFEIIAHGPDIVQYGWHHRAGATLKIIVTDA